MCVFLHKFFGYNLCFVFLGETIDGIQDFIQILEKIFLKDPQMARENSPRQNYLSWFLGFSGDRSHILKQRSSEWQCSVQRKTHIVTSQFVYTWAFLSFLATGSAFSTKVTHLGLRHLQSRILLTIMTAMVL